MPSDQIEPFSVQDFGPPGWIPRPPTGITTPKLNIDTQHVSLENVSLASNMATFGIYLKSLGGRYFDMESFFSLHLLLGSFGPSPALWRLRSCKAKSPHLTQLVPTALGFSARPGDSFLIISHRKA